jgi:hypothetical protein
METAAIIIVIGSALLAAAIGFGLAWAYDRYRSLRYPLYWFAGGSAVIGVLLSLMVISGWPMSLLRVEERLDIRRVELTHDVLCGVVRAAGPRASHSCSRRIVLTSRASTRASWARRSARSAR